jgi:hypothetical protein
MDADSIIQELGCGPQHAVSHSPAATVEDLVRIRSPSMCCFCQRLITRKVCSTVDAAAVAMMYAIYRPLDVL